MGTAAARASEPRGPKSLSETLFFRQIMQIPQIKDLDRVLHVVLHLANFQYTKSS